MTAAQVTGSTDGRFKEILSGEALTFLAELHRRFEPTRRSLLTERAARQEAFDRGERPDFRADTAAIRSGDWSVAEPPADLRDRRVEITGPTDRKMVINALNSGARCFMADFEDAHSPTWTNMIEGQVNLFDAVRRTISHEENDKSYELSDRTATLLVRPRGWHLDEPRVVVDGEPMSGSLVDAGLYLFHNAAELLDRGSGPYFYLAKLEGHLEARLWNDVFVFAQERLGIPHGSVRATVLIEVITAAFEMEEILYELRDHSSGLNAGRWDYIFSVIKKFREHPEFLLPDRSSVTMAVPFMRAYAEALVRACHRRGAHAMGGMSALIPSRKDPAINEVALPRVRADKERECSQGFDGAWVAHPDLIPVVTEVFDAALGDQPNQIDRLREDVDVSAADLLDVTIPGAAVTDGGVHDNVSVGLRYLAAWLGGSGAVAIDNLMEDTATAEISRSQIWQWIRHGAETTDGSVVTRERVSAALEDEVQMLRDAGHPGRIDDARDLFATVCLEEAFPEFLTPPGMAMLG